MEFCYVWKEALNVHKRKKWLRTTEPWCVRVIAMCTSTPQDTGDGAAGAQGLPKGIVNPQWDFLLDTLH